MNPEFAADTMEYTAYVSNDIASITVWAVTEDSNATLTVDGIATISGTSSEAISLEVGENTIDIIVIAEDGTTLIYSINVVRAEILSSNANLESLECNFDLYNFPPGEGEAFEGVYRSEFSPDIGLEFAPMAEDENAKVYVNDVFCARGSKVTLYALNMLEGDADFRVTIRVVAQDGTEMIYYGAVGFLAPD